MSKRVIVIYDDSREAPDNCRIIPAALVAHNGDLVLFWNAAGEKVRVEFEGASPFSDSTPINLDSGKEESRTVEEAESGTYPYKATCCNSGVEARGSRPIIIIYKYK